MKKLILIFLTTFIFINVKAAGLSVNVSCPDSAAANAEVSCTLNATSSNSWSVCSLQMNYSFEGGAVFLSFTNNSLFDDSTTNNSGATLNIRNNSCFTSSAQLGILKFKMPATGVVTLTVNNITATDSTRSESATASAINKTVRVRSTVNTLSNITLSNGTLSPAFNIDTTSYRATIDAPNTTITVAKTDNTSRVSGDGTKNLNYGENIFNIEVTSESGAKKIYTITITRPDNREAVNTLSSLSISNTNISPSFASSNTSYTAKVKADVEKITVYATLTSNKSTFVNGFGTREVNLEYGSNKVQVKVLSENQKEKVYTIVVTREDDRSTNNFLKKLELSDGKIDFDENNTEYSVIVNFDVEKINITGEPSHEKATVEGFGEKTLAVGENVFQIVVKAENTKTKTYKIKVNRLSQDESTSSNTNLTKFEIEGFTINYNNSTNSFRLKLDETQMNLNFDYETEDPKAVVNVKGNENLKDGSVVIFQITSTNGTVREIEIIIDKDEVQETTSSNDNTLLYVIISIACILAVGAIIVFVMKKKNRRIDL